MNIIMTFYTYSTQAHMVLANAAWEVLHACVSQIKFEQEFITVIGLSVIQYLCQQH